jgi:hypothetical protein
MTSPPGTTTGVIRRRRRPCNHPVHGRLFRGNCAKAEAARLISVEVAECAGSDVWLDLNTSAMGFEWPVAVLNCDETVASEGLSGIRAFLRALVLPPFGASR